MPFLVQYARFFTGNPKEGYLHKNAKGDWLQAANLRVDTSLGQFLFYRRVRTVTRHLRSVSFYFTDESEPSLVII